MLIPQLLVPVGLMILVLVINRTLPNTSVDPPLTLDTTPFQKIAPQTVNFFYSGNSTTTLGSQSSVSALTLARAYANSFQGMKNTKTEDVNLKFKTDNEMKAIIGFNRTFAAEFAINAFGFDSYLQYMGTRNGEEFRDGNIVAGYFGKDSDILLENTDGSSVAICIDPPSQLS